MTMSLIRPDWPLQEKVVAFTTTRSGGVSLPPFDNFNLALHVSDNSSDVYENRNRLRANELPNTQIKWLKQTHSNIVVNASAIEADSVEADAAFTVDNNIACAVLTADCLPILLSDRDANCIAAIHAGWRGVINGVIERTVTAMRDYAKPEYAWLGPAIGVQAFEVGDEVYAAYSQRDSQLTNSFYAKKTGKWSLDIYQAAKLVLNSADIHNVFGGEYCTYSDSDQFFSYRRQSNTGRMATIISKR